MALKLWFMRERAPGALIRSAEEVRRLFWLVDWMMILPEELEQEFRQDLARFEEERHVPYVSSIERLAKKEGHVEEIQENIATILELRFGSAGKRLAARVRKFQDLEQLRDVLLKVVKADKIAEVRRMLPR
jgi:hypothetical protein